MFQRKLQMGSGSQMISHDYLPTTTPSPSHRLPRSVFEMHPTLRVPALLASKGTIPGSKNQEGR